MFWFFERENSKSGFEFLNKDFNPRDAFFSVKEKYESNNKTFVVLEKREKDLIFSKTFSFSNDDYFISITDNILNLSVSEVTFAPFSKIDRSSVDLYADESSIFNPASFAYLGPAFKPLQIITTKYLFQIWMKTLTESYLLKVGFLCLSIILLAQLLLKKVPT